MTWQAASTSSALTLASAFQTLQLSSTDMVTPLTPREIAQVSVEVTFQAGAVDDGEWQILASPDDGTTWDTEPLLAGSIIAVASTTVRLTVELLGVERFKLQMRQAGSTDTTNSGKAIIRTDGVSAT